MIENSFFRQILQMIFFLNYSLLHKLLYITYKIYRPFPIKENNRSLRKIMFLSSRENTDRYRGTVPNDLQSL